MKRLFLFFSLIWMLSIHANAMRWGVEGGVDLSRFQASKELKSFGPECGWFVGVKIKKAIPPPNLLLDAALLYSQNEIEYESNNVTRERKMRQFAVPVNLRYEWQINGTLCLYMATGPQWNWLLSKSRLGNEGRLKHSCFDWNIGGGIEILKHVQLGFNYNIPLGKMGEFNNVNLEGHTWNIRLAYFF